MRTETVTRNLYKFSELPEDTQEQVLNNLRDINLDYDWWQCTYGDAENIGLKITGFDLDRHRHATGNFTLSACEVAANIFRDHGESCETHKTASNFMIDWQPVFDNYMDENHPDYESLESENKMLEIESEFLKSLLGDYSIMLQHEYEYLYSDEAIIETIKCNDYEFTETGEIA
jgi:hypothetical protein